MGVTSGQVQAQTFKGLAAEKGNRAQDFISGAHVLPPASLSTMLSCDLQVPREARKPAKNLPETDGEAQGKCITQFYQLPNHLVLGKLLGLSQPNPLRTLSSTIQDCYEK